MKPFLLPLLLILVLGASISIDAQTNADAIPPAAMDAGDQARATLDKHAKPILADLNLNDSAKESAVRAALAEYLGELDAWHAQNDAQIKGLWAAFNKAHGKLDATNTDAIGAKIDAIYATFKPSHDKFIASLSSVLSPEQVETVEDTLTVKKVEVTYKNYQLIFHGLTPEQNAVILAKLKAAREQAIDAKAMTEKSAFFKKYKIQIEAYLTAQGYNVKQSYKDFVAKQKAEMAAKPGNDQ
jgi:Protein of unknown function (DUF3826)